MRQHVQQLSPLDRPDAATLIADPGNVQMSKYARRMRLQQQHGLLDDPLSRASVADRRNIGNDITIDEGNVAAMTSHLPASDASVTANFEGKVASPAPTTWTPTCRRGHLMTWRVVRPLTYFRGWFCDRCDAPISVNAFQAALDGDERAAHCSACVYDLCPMCLRKDRAEFRRATASKKPAWKAATQEGTTKYPVTIRVAIISRLIVVFFLWMAFDFVSNYM